MESTGGTFDSGGSEHQQEDPMRRLALTVREVAFIAGTRGALGLGAGLLLSTKIVPTRRRALGWTLVAVGIGTTIPAARMLFAKRHAAIAS